MMDQDTMDHFNESLECLKAFLADNVKVYPEPQQVIVFNLTFDRKTLFGEFECQLDDLKIDGLLEYSFEINKLPTLFLPMFYSPCGVPASYAQIELTYKTKLAIQKAVKALYDRNFGDCCHQEPWLFYAIDVNE